MRKKGGQEGGDRKILVSDPSDGYSFDI